MIIQRLTAVVSAYEFCPFDPESKDYAEWVQEQPDNFTVRIGKLVSVAANFVVFVTKRTQQGACG